MMSIKSFIYGLLLCCFTPSLHADALTDGTLGSQVHLTDPHFTIGENLGQRVGNNLFHSFERFNVPTDGSATFTGSLGIQNVLARVTGPTSSNIDGTLRSTIPDANLYLMNLNGIRFGEHARLDVLGSFHATTADSIRLGKDGQFNAREPSKSLLTVAPPSAFGFLSNTPATIRVEKSFLKVPSGKTFSLLGGDLQIQDGTLFAPQGHLNLVSVASPGLLPVDSLDTQTFPLLGKISLTHSPDMEFQTIGGEMIANVDASGHPEGPGGRIFIRGGQLLVEGGYIFSDSYGDLPGEDIDISINGRISLTQGAGITADNLGYVREGNIYLTATSTISLTGQNSQGKSSKLSTNNFSGVSGGNISVVAPVLELTGGRIQSASDEGTGGSGNITLNVGELRLQDNGRINLNSYGNGQAGKLTINANNLVVRDGSFISASNGGSGEGGKVTITARNLLSISENSNISVDSGDGKAGDININTRQLILQSSFISSLSSGAGSAGNIYITADKATLSDSEILTVSFDAGGGDITLNLKDRLYFTNSDISTASDGNTPADKGGNLTIGRPQFLILDKYSRLYTDGFMGNGGNITIGAQNLIKSSQEVTIEASSELGIDGEVTINAFQPNLAGMLTTSSRNYLRLGLLKPPRWCGQNNRYKKPKSSFAIRLQDMLWPSPSDLRFYSPVLGEE
jgi:filamentous hemagglutinin family protein